MPSFVAPIWRWPTRGRTWATSVFGSNQHGAILLMPRKVLGPLGEGDPVEVSFEVDMLRLLDPG